MPVLACGELGTHHIEAEILNPGDWFGKVWLVEVGGTVWPQFFAVEAAHVQGALDAFCDSEKGHLIHIDIDTEGGDYGYAVKAGDSIGGYVAPQDGWVNLKGTFLTDPDVGKYLSDPNLLGNAGTPCDLDHVMVHGEERVGWSCVYKDAADPDCQSIPPALYPDRELRFQVEDEEGQFIKGNFRTEKEAIDWANSHGDDFQEALFVLEQEQLDTIADHGGEG